MRRLAVLLAMAGLAGCGGGGGDGPTDGRQVFVDAGCGACHQLAEADTTGTVGPSLDRARLTPSQVERWVRAGGPNMPAYTGRLSDEEMTAVSRFVSSASR